MAKYYLHLRDHTGEILDSEGVELTGIEAVKKVVLEGARDLLSSDLKSDGMVDLRCRIDAEDRHGEVIHTLKFKDAFHFIPEAA
jgi:hypothetical protein